MITRLLRRDPILAAQVPVFFIVAALVGWMASTLTRTFSQLAELSASAGGQTELGTDAGLAVTAMLGVQAVFISAAVSKSLAFKWDGVQSTTRSQPMELMLPIAPRSAWCARLIAHGIAIAVPLLTTLLVFTVLGQFRTLPVLWKVAAASGTVVLFVFGLFSEEAAPSGRRALASMLVVLVLLVCGFLMYLDLGGFQANAPTRFRFGLEVALAVAAVWALRGYRRLPASWGLPVNRSKGLTLSSHPSQHAPATSPQQRVTERPRARPGTRQWAMISATICPLRVVTTSLCGFAVMAIAWFGWTAWVTVFCAAGFVVIGMQWVLADARFLAALPITRRRLLGVVLAPLGLGMALGCLSGRALDGELRGMRPVVTLDDQVEKRPEIAEADPYFRYDSWMDVVVPLHHWRLAGVDGVPDQVSPDGERVTPRAVHPLGLGFLTVYNPYDAPLGSSQAFTAWQLSRALQAQHGVSLDPAELSERYLQTNRNGQVDFATAQVARNLAERKAEDRPWYGTLGTLTYDYPETVARWDARRAALPVLAAVSLSTLLGALLLRVRQGTRVAKLVGIAVPLLFGLSFSFDTMLGVWLGPEHPQVLFAIAGEALLSWLPDSALFVWLLTAAVAAMGFNFLGRALDRGEVLARKLPRLRSAS